MKYSSLFVLTSTFLLVSTFSFSQEQVLLNNNETGQGLLRAKQGECFIITPKHVIDEVIGDFDVVGHYGLKGTAIKEKIYETADLAILNVIDGDLRCEEWLKMSNFDVMLSTQSSGHLSIRDEDGTIAPIEVNIISSGDEFILIKPKDSDKCIQPGMSGSTFLVNGASAGILLSVDTDTCEGKIMRKDVIMRLTEPFFEVKQSEKDKSRIELDKITEKLASRGLNCRNYWCGFSKTRLSEYANDISKIYLGSSPDKLKTVVDIRELIEQDSDENGYVPIFSDTNRFYMKVEFIDGTFSGIKEIIHKEKSEWTSNGK